MLTLLFAIPSFLFFSFSSIRYLDGSLDLSDIADRVSTELVEKDDYKHILPTTDPAHLEFLMAPLGMKIYKQKRRGESRRGEMWHPR